MVVVKDAPHSILSICGKPFFFKVDSFFLMGIIKYLFFLYLWFEITSVILSGSTGSPTAMLPKYNATAGEKRLILSRSSLNSVINLICIQERWSSLDAIYDEISYMMRFKANFRAG